MIDNPIESSQNTTIHPIEMSEEGEISPVREKSSPESTHSLEEVTIKPSQKKGEKRTPSPRGRKVKTPNGGEKTLIVFLAVVHRAPAVANQVILKE